MEDHFLTKLNRQRKKLKNRREQQHLRKLIYRVAFFVFLGVFIIATSTIVYNYSFNKEKVLLNDQISKGMTSTEVHLAKTTNTLISQQMNETEERLKEHIDGLLKQEIKCLEDKLRDYIVFRVKNEFAHLKIDDKVQLTVQTQIKDKVKPMINTEVQHLKYEIINFQNYRSATTDKELRKLKEDYDTLHNILQKIQLNSVK